MRPNPLQSFTWQSLKNILPTFPELDERKIVIVTKFNPDMASALTWLQIFILLECFPGWQRIITLSRRQK